MDAALRPLIVFVHVPKTAGTTIRWMLERRLRGAWAETAEEAAALVASAAKTDVDFIAGHVPYGVHSHGPRPPIYVTMLREPISRVASHYWFVRADRQHYLYAAIAERRLTLREYAEAGCTLSAEIENGQVWLFSERARRLGCADREALEEARAVLRERFSVVGTTERFRESVAVLQAVLGIRPAVQTPRNVGPPRPPLDDETRSALARRNELDRELHAEANRLLDETIGRLGARFDRELRRLRRLDAAHRAVHRVSGRAARLVFER